MPQADSAQIWSRAVYLADLDSRSSRTQTVDNPLITYLAPDIISLCPQFFLYLDHGIPLIAAWYWRYLSLCNRNLEIPYPYSLSEVDPLAVNQKISYHLSCPKLPLITMSNSKCHISPKFVKVFLISDWIGTIPSISNSGFSSMHWNPMKIMLI